MTAFVAITLGNTRAALAWVRDGALAKVHRAAIDRLGDLRSALAPACPDCGGEVTPIAVASVNPSALERLERLLAEMTLPRPHVARLDFQVPIRTDVETPERVGVDRLLGALAAHRRCNRACIVVDCGTAITVNAVAAAGTFLGGAIFPGLAMMARALAEGTALLPAVSLADATRGRAAAPAKAGRRDRAAPAAPPVIGKNTEAAMIAGILSGAAGAVLELVRSARSAVGAEARVFLTGGDARRLTGLLPHDCCEVVPNLVLEGLAIAYGEWTRSQMARS